MKAMISILLLVVFGLNSYSQKVLDTDGLNNTDNVFLYALKEYCKTISQSANKVVYVEKNSNTPIGDSWPKKIEGLKIEYLYTQKEYKNALKSNNGKIAVVGIRPLNFKDGNFYVSLITFRVSYKKRKINFINGGGWNIYFDYDPVKKGLVYKSKENYG